MTDYSKTVNFASKDALLTGNPNKVVQGTEIDTEFNNIGTAIATKADKASPTFTGTINSALIVSTIDDASNTTPTSVHQLTHTTSGTPGNGIGVGSDYIVETSAGNNEIGMKLQTLVTDVTATSEDFDFVVKLMAAGATAAEKFRVSSAGVATATSLVGGTLTATSGSITDSSGAISFDNENLTTTGSATVGTFTSTGIDDNASSTAIIIDSSQRVAIGQAQVQGTPLEIACNTGGFGLGLFGRASDNNAAITFYSNATGGTPNYAIDATPTLLRIIKAGVSEYEFSATALDLTSNNLTTTGTAATGALTVTTPVSGVGFVLDTAGAQDIQQRFHEGGVFRGSVGWDTSEGRVYLNRYGDATKGISVDASHNVFASDDLTVTGSITGAAITGSGILSIDDTTDSSSTTTGSIHTDGGLGVAKTAWIGTLKVRNAGNVAVVENTVSNEDLYIQTAGGGSDAIQMYSASGRRLLLNSSGATLGTNLTIADATNDVTVTSNNAAGHLILNGGGTSGEVRIYSESNLAATFDGSATSLAGTVSGVAANFTGLTTLGDGTVGTFTFSADGHRMGFTRANTSHINATSAGGALSFGVNGTDGSTRGMTLSSLGAVIITTGAGHSLQTTAGARFGSSTIIGSTSVSPDGMLHVYSGSAGSVTANTEIDDLVVEHSTNGGVSVLGPDAANMRYAFGSPSDTLGAYWEWTYSTGTMLFGAHKVGATATFVSDNGVTNLTISGASGSEAAKLEGGLSLSGATPTAGGGIAFPATQVASADANTLDDYEEGTWTPTIGGTSESGTGEYTKIGRMVFIRGSLTVTTIGAGSTSIISGLPFTSAATGNPTANLSVGYFTGLAVSPNILGGFVGAGGTTITMTGNTSAGTGVTAGLGVFGDGARVDFSVAYFV